MLMEGFSMVLSDPLSVVLVAVGTLIGTIFGAIPGLTATMAVTICLPMTFAMSDSRAIALLMALYIGGISGGLVSSILLNIPGTPASMVTAFDGAPMARKGEGAKALGTGIGILPGIGGGTAGIMSYTTIKNRSKTPEKLGTGIMDGVVASETANNAAIGGAMIPLLTLGIPGDGITAILLGSLIIHGIAPGPLIFEKSGALMYSIYLIIGLSSLFMMIFMLFGIKGFVKILSAPQGLLMPIILCMCCVGAFGCSNRMFDVWCLLIFGLIAVVIRAMELPIMPVAIGFILGPIFEKNLRRAESFMTSGPAELLHHPIALVILVITVVMIIFSLRSNKRAAEREAAVAAAEEQE